MSSYQPLSEVRKTLKVKWYRTKIDRNVMKQLSERSDAQGWFQAGGHFGTLSNHWWLDNLLLEAAVVATDAHCALVSWGRDEFLHGGCPARIGTWLSFQNQIIE